MRCHAWSSFHDHFSALQSLVADGSAHCANGFYWPKVSSGLWAGAEITAPPGEDTRAPFVPLARPFRCWLYPQTPSSIQQTFLSSERSRGPRESPQHCLAFYQTPTLGLSPHFCRAPGPGPPPARQGRDRAAGELQYITWHMAHAA